MFALQGDYTRKTLNSNRRPGITKNSIISVIFILLYFAGCRSVDGGAGESPLPETAGASAKAPAGTSVNTAPVSKAASLREALREAGEEMAASLPPLSSVAVISVASDAEAEGEYALEELTMLLVGAKKFRVVDRRNLDLIREEQNFQLSGEVDDETAVSIGHLTGAAVVITGSIAPYGQERYLRLRALDVETAQIQAMSSRSFEK